MVNADRFLPIPFAVLLSFLMLPLLHYYGKVYYLLFVLFLVSILLALLGV